MPTKAEKSNVFTVRIKPELVTILERYAEDNTNGNRSAAVNHFLEIGLQQEGILPKPVSMEDVEKLFDTKLEEAQEALKKHTDETAGKQSAVLNEMVRTAIRDMMPVQLSETQQKLLEAGEAQSEQISDAVSAALEERLEKIEEQTKPKKKNAWQRFWSGE